MLFQLPPRPSSMLASTLAVIGLTLTAAGCSGVTPLGPDPAATMPPPRQLGSPIIMQAMLGRPRTLPAGTCPAGYVSLSGPGAADNSGWCYRKLGAPVTITSAGVARYHQNNPSGHPGQAGASALMINLPAADRATLTAITTKAYQAKGFVDISVAGQTWAIPEAMAPLTQGQFEISLPSSTLALQLQHLLDPSS